MSKQKRRARYLIRILAGYNLADLHETDNLEEAIELFRKSVEMAGEERREVPYMIFLADRETEKVILEKTELPGEPWNKDAKA